jgi:3-dehydroquinate dehydratase/shikimate dehydrogenase
VRDATLLAVPITAATPPLPDQARAAKAAGADLIELRADLIGNMQAVRHLLSQPRGLPIILTIRSSGEGGNCHDDDAARAALFEKLAGLAPEYLDVEFAAWRGSPELRAAVARACRPPDSAARHVRADGPAAPKLILSRHDLNGTPAELDQALQPLLEAPADVVKAVFAAPDVLDACRLLSHLQRCSRERKVMLLATEAAGLVTRVLARKFNAFATFAALQHGRESAPGQPTLGELIDIYRWREIGPATRVFGLAGWPVSHSYGPRIHNAAMRAAAIDGVYIPLPVSPTYAAFAAFMDYIADHPDLDLNGLSVTIPHKEHAARWLAERGLAISETARRCGATNTLTRTARAGWIGDNTDVAGFLAVLGAIPDSCRRREAAVLGAGGAARAAVCALQMCNHRVTVFNRTASRGAQLAGDLGCAALPWDERVRAPHELIVNCTSIGMTPDSDSTPMPADALPTGPSATVIDAVYTPARTRLLHEAHDRGCRTVSGTELFLAQAAAQFERWHSQPAPLQVMRHHLEAK